MRVFGYTWAGVRTADLKAATQFFTDVLGLSPIEQRDHMAQFEMPSGQLFEIFGSGNRYFPLHTCPVLAFQVDDVRVARKELESRAIECVTEIEGSESEAWFYFRGPDGILYELWQTVRPLNAIPAADQLALTIARSSKHGAGRRLPRYLPRELKSSTTARPLI